MSVKIASLVTELTAETASFHRDMGKAVSALNSHSAQMNRMIGGVDKMFRSLSFTMAAVAGPAAVGALIKANINLGDQLNKTSQKVGISVEKLSAYQYAAKLSDVSNETLTASLAKLGKTMSEAVADPTTQQARAFANLGIQLKDSDGKVRSLDAVFEQLARTLAKTPDSAAKIQYEMLLLGRSGYEIAPLLNSLEQLTAEAERTGRVISTDFAQASERFNDELTRMGDAMGLFLARSDSGATILDSLVTGLKGVQFVAMGAAQGFEELGTSIGAVGAASAAFATGEFRQARVILQDLDAELAAIQKRGEAARGALFSETPVAAKPAAAGDAGSGAGGGGAPLSPLATGTDQSAEKFMKSMRDLAKATAQAQASITRDEAMQSEARLMIARNEWFNKVEFSKLTTEQQREFLTEFQQWNAAATEAQAQRDLEIQDARIAADLAEFERVAQSLMTEEELLAQSHMNQLFIIEDSYNKDLVSFTKYRETKLKLEKQYAEKSAKAFRINNVSRAEFDKMKWYDQLSFMTDTVSQMTAIGANASKRQFELNKKAASANVVVSTAVAIMKAYAEWGPLIGTGFAILMAAAGAAQLRSINSAQFDSATSAPSVGGGASMPVTSAPQVSDISSSGPAAAPATLQENPQPRRITIDVRGEGMVSMEWVRETLMPAIQEAYEDGV